MKKEKGILIIAVGHANYGNMACNLAATLKAFGNDLPIHLAYTTSAIKHLDSDKLSVFDSQKEVHPKHYDNIKMDWIKVKISMYELSPFDETLFIDADCLALWKKPINDLFELCKDENLVIPYWAKTDIAAEDLKEDFSWWVNIKDLKKDYGFDAGLFYNYNSELVYFKKCESVKAYFYNLKKIYEKPLCKFVKWANTMPDELAFSICSLQLGIYSNINIETIYHGNGEMNFTPTNSIVEIANNFHLFSTAGIRQSEMNTECYNSISQIAFQKIGLKYPYKLTPKANYLNERKTI